MKGHDWVRRWNLLYPVDLVWRIKNKVQFGSTEHRSMDFLSMLFNLIQEYDIEEYRKSNEEIDDFDLLTDAAKNTENVVKMSKKEVDEEWDKLDLDAINAEILNKDDVNAKRDNIQG